MKAVVENASLETFLHLGLKFSQLSDVGLALPDLLV
jgi:hypothetical protein